MSHSQADTLYGFLHKSASSVIAAAGAASRIAFSNGLLDPWHGGGVLEDAGDQLNAIIIPEVRPANSPPCVLFLANLQFASVYWCQRVLQALLPFGAMKTGLMQTGTGCRS